MNSTQPRNATASIRQKLLNIATKHHDIWSLAQTFAFHAATLADAIRDIFEGSGTQQDARAFDTLTSELSADASSTLNGRRRSSRDRLCQRKVTHSMKRAGLPRERL